MAISNSGFLLAAALALTVTGALAQPVDPYADSDRKQRAATYLAYRDQVLANIKLFYFAKGCKVLTKDGADGLRNHYNKTLWETPQFLNAEPTSSKIARTQAAEREGTAQATEPDACDWFKARPEVVRSLREMQERGVH
jgi:hypothetical protein